MIPLQQGHPDGTESLARSPEWYEATYQAEHVARRLSKAVVETWQERRTTALIHAPAARLCRGPVLDLGCGPGHFAEVCQAGGVPYALGVDPSATAIRMAGRVMPGRVVVATADEALNDIADPSTYQTVALLEVLEHLYDDISRLSLISAGKVVVLSVPNYHCEGHCRWFGNAEQVVRRYGEALAIDAIEETSKGDHRWWIVRGVRV